VFPFVLLRSENNLVEANRKIESEKKQKEKRNRTEFLNWTSETHAKRIQFRFISLISEKKWKRIGRTLFRIYVLYMKTVGGGRQVPIGCVRLNAQGAQKKKIIQKRSMAFCCSSSATTTKKEGGSLLFIPSLV
jgi:hypothetical protein